MSARWRRQWSHKYFKGPSRQKSWPRNIGIMNEVKALIEDGWSNQEIIDELGVEIKTVERGRRLVKAKSE